MLGVRRDHSDHRRAELDRRLCDATRRSQPNEHHAPRCVGRCTALVEPDGRRATCDGGLRSARDSAKRRAAKRDAGSRPTVCARASANPARRIQRSHSFGPDTTSSSCGAANHPAGDNVQCRAAITVGCETTLADTCPCALADPNAGALADAGAAAQSFGGRCAAAAAGCSSGSWRFLRRPVGFIGAVFRARSAEPTRVGASACAAAGCS
jgi:hypothetical protein